MKQIKRALAHWNITEFSVAERCHENTERIMCRIEAEDSAYFLKGIPREKGETTIRGNVLAHECLGNHRHMAPAILRTSDGRSYIAQDEHWFYLMEYIAGKNLEETEADEYALGQLAAKLHSIREYTYPSSLNQDKSRFYGWFEEKPFKAEFDRILDELPNFSQYEQCFIHSDLGPHNAMRRDSGEVILIDLDDAGIGSKYLDLGWAFIMQFVDFNHQTEEMRYRFDLALAFLRGYYGEKQITQAEYDLIWQGAVFMHISYMQVYGPDAVNSLWQILKFGMDQKEELWEQWQSLRKMKQERIDIFRRNLPFIVRDDWTVGRILSHVDNHFIEKRDEAGALIGLSVVNRDVILLLCVDEAYRRRGIGTWLLKQSEELIRGAGHGTCRTGVGFDYLMPGVPTSVHFFPARNIRLYPELDSSASTFFEKRGYKHSWENADCFDMRFDLKNLVETAWQIGDTIQGITYRFATLADMEGILECTEDACSEFSVFYREEGQYAPESPGRVLIALKGQEVCGALMVGPERGMPGLGSIGCTTVKRNCQGQHIATNLVLLGTRALKDMGMREGYLSYTYSGLDRLYGAAGYQIKVFFMMAEKILTPVSD